MNTDMACGQVWKQAHASALEGAEHESTVHNATITALNRQMAALQAAAGGAVRYMLPFFTVADICLDD